MEPKKKIEDKKHTLDVVWNHWRCIYLCLFAGFCFSFFFYFFVLFFCFFFLYSFVLFCFTVFVPRQSKLFCPVRLLALLRMCSSVATLEGKKNTVRWFNFGSVKKKKIPYFPSPCTPTLKRKQSGYRKAFSFIASLHLLVVYVLLLLLLLFRWRG